MSSKITNAITPVIIFDELRSRRNPKLVEYSKHN
jgi:hypothetical protein